MDAYKVRSSNNFQSFQEVVNEMYEQGYWFISFTHAITPSDNDVYTGIFKSVHIHNTPSSGGFSKEQNDGIKD